MGNTANPQEGHDDFASLPDSPTVRVQGTRDFELTVTKDPGRGRDRLPKYVTFRLTQSHCELWERRGNEIIGKRALKAMSYFNILGWGHSPVVFRMIESTQTVVQGGKMAKKRNVYEFFSREGKEITSILSTNCHAIVADIETKKSENKLVEKEKEWDEYWTTREEHHQDSSSPQDSAGGILDCMSPLAGREPTGALRASLALSLDSPTDLLSGELPANLEADIARIKSESPVRSPDKPL
eukprot:TRINITY_DN16121_c0_g1_i2.p1 TRINITY_DN16121_c0_g1~~TRINITY_DN16121_c0_g1_i2.p1  ORF type:complete len:240 (-),score=62.80 TRINITY_DN16121_c0_g1_i2:295-1014(-)